MKKLKLITLVVMWLASAMANADTKSPASADNDTNATREIRDWLDRFTKVFSAKDVDEIMAFYADDVIAYDVVPPLQYVGKAAYRADYQQFLAQYDSNLHIDIRDLHVGAAGDLGYATGLESISGTLKNGKKSELWIRFTVLLRKSNGRWLDFHDHISVPADIESGRAMLELKP